GEGFFHDRNPDETRDLIERVLASEAARQDEERRNTRSGPTVTGKSKRKQKRKQDIVETLTKKGETKSDVYKRLEQRLKKAEDTDSSDFYFSLWDFGGQSVYHITHQVFLAYRVIYIFVTDLTKGLEDILELEPQAQTERCWKKDMPLQDYMRFWTNSIHTHAMRDFAIKAHGQDESGKHTIVAPPVIIAGTKKDLLEGDVEKESQRRLCKLRDYLRQHTTSACESHITMPMFALDNKSRHNDKTTDPSIESLRKRIQELAKEFCFLGDIPVNWLILELTLRSEEKETLQLSEVHRLGKERDLSTAEINDALKYFHDVGEIIHFADVRELKDTVIIDPRWLINLFRLLITNTVSNKTNPELSFELLNMFDELYNDGIMKKELVSQWLKMHNREQDTDILLKVLEMFDIICQSTLKIDEYYFPCLLQSKLQENVLFPPEYKSSDPLYFHFHGNFLPEGLYYRLIVRCLRNHPKAKLFQDHARFIHNESNDHHFTLCRKGADIELKMLRSHWRIIQHLDEKVRQEVETSLNELIKMYTPGLTYHICVKCGCGGHRDGIWLRKSKDFDDGCTDITPVLDQGVKQLHCERNKMLVNVTAISYWYKESKQSPIRTFEEIVHLFCYLDSQLDS
uniref:Probable serine/threonine-protein kinase roco4-like n=1 Tax=Saccoglossus kowalevskii TaxID=10224 RepID=A0ABM0M0P2_SACKO